MPEPENKEEIPFAELKPEPKAEEPKVEAKPEPKVEKPAPKKAAPKAAAAKVEVKVEASVAVVEEPKKPVPVSSTPWLPPARNCCDH